MADADGTCALAGFVDNRCRHRWCVDKPEAYRMVGACYNCGAGPLLGLFTARHEHGNDGECPLCGTRRLHWDRIATPDEIPAEAS